MHKYKTNQDAETSSSQPPASGGSKDRRPPPKHLQKNVRPVQTGYSSVPPARLAEEQVQVPSSLRPNPVPTIEAPRAERSPARRDEPLLDSSDSAPPTMLREASVLPDEPPKNTRQQSREKSFSKTFRSSGVSAPPHPESEKDIIAAAREQLTESEMPVPSGSLDPAALEQLDELNEAIASSRRPNLSLAYDAAKSSLADETVESIAAPSSDLGPSSKESPSPGSVPRSQELPGQEPRSDSDLPVVGRYEVLARLKRGGMGSVYMCRLTGSAGFRRLFAMKVLHGHLAEQGDILDGFFREARVLGSLHHPNIVGIADVGTPAQPYIVLDYVEGGSLAEIYRATTKGRDPALVVAVVLDALRGLSTAHNARGENDEPLDLVHCDVTPHNLLVGIDGACRVTDFGIARTGASTNRDEIVRGKPGYLSPEALEHKKLDRRADVFAMGVVLYAGLTGVEPFAGESSDQTMRKVLSEVPEPPSRVGLRPPPSLDWVCLKALSRDPDERFQSADEMAQQLERIAAREGLLASSPEVAKWVKASLAPTLAARRAASLRGTANGGDGLRPSTIPPPAVAPPEEAPSAAEHTGPLEPPTSSRAFNDKTEVLPSPSVTQKEEQPKKTTWVLYAALTVALFTLVWVALRPDSMRGLFNVNPRVTPAAATPETPPQSAPQEETATTPRADSDGNVVIPPIETGKDR